MWLCECVEGCTCELVHGSVRGPAVCMTVVVGDKACDYKVFVHQPTNQPTAGSKGAPLSRPQHHHGLGEGEGGREKRGEVVEGE